MYMNDGNITVAKNAIIWTTPCKESLQLVA